MTLYRLIRSEHDSYVGNQLYLTPDKFMIKGGEPVELTLNEEQSAYVSLLISLGAIVKVEIPRESPKKEAGEQKPPSDVVVEEVTTKTRKTTK